MCRGLTELRGGQDVFFVYRYAGLAPPETGAQKTMTTQARDKPRCCYLTQSKIDLTTAEADQFMPPNRTYDEALLSNAFRYRGQPNSKSCKNTFSSTPPQP